MKAQETIEFLFSILAVMLAISLLLSIFSMLSSNAKSSKLLLEATMNAEQDARLLESYYSAGLSADFYLNSSGRLENSNFKVVYGGQLIVVDGVFDRAVSEPS